MLSLFLASWPTKTIAVIENLFKLLADSISTDALWVVEMYILNNMNDQQTIAAVHVYQLSIAEYG